LEKIHQILTIVSRFAFVPILKINKSISSLLKKKIKMAEIIETNFFVKTARDLFFNRVGLRVEILLH
jgi:predicted thioredoxin/glutaredoxin